MKKYIISTMMMSAMILGSSGVYADEILVEEVSPDVVNVGEPDNSSLELTIGQVEVETVVDETLVDSGNESQVNIPDDLPVDGGIVVDVIVEDSEQANDSSNNELIVDTEVSESKGELAQENNANEEDEVRDSMGLVDEKKEEQSEVSVTSQPKEVTISSFDVPVVTDTGYKIVSTQDGNVLVETSTGEIVTKTAESIGAVKQSDGTIAVKDNEGKLQVLPATGDDSILIVSLLGYLLLGVALLYSLRDKLKDFFKKNK